MGGFTGSDLTLSVPKTDGQIPIAIAPGIALSGTWSVSDSSNVISVDWTASSESAQYYAMPIVPLHRTATGKGIRLKSVTVTYSVGSADTSNDVLQFWIVKQIIPENGSTPTATVLAGDSDSDYDDNHNTSAKRLATGNHTLTVTIPTNERTYMADGNQLWLKVKISDAADSDLVFALKGAVANADILMF